MNKMYPYMIIDSLSDIPLTSVTIAGIELKSIFSGDEVLISIPVSLKNPFENYSEAKAFLIKEVFKALKDKRFGTEKFKHPSLPDFKKTFSCFGGDGFYICVADDKELGYEETLKKAKEVVERYISETYPLEKELSDFISKLTGVKVNIEINDSKNIAQACYTTSRKSFYLFSRLGNGEYFLQLGADLVPYKEVLETFALFPVILALYINGKLEFTDRRILEVPPNSGNIIGEDRIKRAKANAYATFVASSLLGTSEKVALFFKEKVLPEYKISEEGPYDIHIAQAISKLQIFSFLHLSGFLTERDFRNCTKLERRLIERFLKE